MIGEPGTQVIGLQQAGGLLRLTKPRAGASGQECTGEERREEASGHLTSLRLAASAARGTGSRVATWPRVSQRK